MYYWENNYLTDELLIIKITLIISESDFLLKWYDYDYIFKINPPLSAFLRFSPSIFALKFLMYLYT